MIETAAIREMLAFARGRTLASLDEIEKSGEVDKILAYRPAPGRAHIGWQFMHVAATDDRMLHMRFLGEPLADPEQTNRFSFGSIPSDDDVPTAPQIRETLAANRQRVIGYIQSLIPEDLERVPPVQPERSLRDWLSTLIWHEAHHHGQIHLSLNIYKGRQT